MSQPLSTASSSAIQPRDLPGPLVVGGVGGSGTRVLALMMQKMGFYVGAYLNHADDNMWFDTLFNRPGWFRSAGDAAIRRALTTFDQAMHDQRSGADLRAVVNVVAAALDKRHLTVISTGSPIRRWTGGTYHRVASLLRLTRPVDRSQFRAWGWKHPLTHFYLSALADFYPDMKFMMVIRHGLDMAFARNVGQTRSWSWVYDLPPAPTPPTPEALLAFWVRANEAVIRVGQARLGERFLAVNFDALCQSPDSEVPKLLDFIGLDVSAQMRQELIAIPHVPTSLGRHRQHDLGQLDPADVEAVRRLGFEIGGPASS